MQSFVSVFAASAFGQNNPNETIGDFLQSIGGKNELARIRSLRAVANCAGPRRKYTTEIYSAKGTRLIFRQVFGKGENFVGQTNGEIFWTKNEKNDDFSLADRSTATVWRSHEFQWMLIEFSERFKNLVYQREESFLGKPAVRLRAVYELGDRADLYFDRETKMLLGFVLYPPAKPSETIRIVFNEWKQIGKVRLPSVVNISDKTGVYTFDFQNILLNKIDEKIFSVPPKVKAMQELLEGEKQARAAHFNRDAKLLVSGLAEDSVEVRNGKILRPDKESAIKRFQTYFENSTFLEWDDIEPPIIKVSDDLTMAYVIVRKRVRRLAKTENGGSEEVTDVFSWLATYRKINGKWMLTAIASTLEPKEK